MLHIEVSRHGFGDIGSLQSRPHEKESGLVSLIRRIGLGAGLGGG